MLYYYTISMSIKKRHILVIDDDKEIASLISTYLIERGYRVTTAYNGMQWRALLRENNFNLIILDIMLPGENGLSLCKMIRQDHDMPIIMLSAANSPEDRIVGLELGADDYMNKPFLLRELLARVQSQIRRYEGGLSLNNKRLTPLQMISFAGWRLDRTTHCLIDTDEISIYLSPKEYNVLLVFLENPNRILSRTQLMDLLYDKACSPFDRSIDVLIGRLRKKIEPDPKNPTLLLTIRGGGYKLTTKVKIHE
ncbi:MAG: response regulator transcription factor [Legionellaceae bacterium]|nr:response regulator transcription factor [Legionellaceae bacterium]